MPRVIYFELGVKEPEKSLEFYRKVFCWEINRMGKMDYWLASTGERQEPGINGAFIKQTADSQPIVYTIAVGEIDPFLERVVQEGGKIILPKKSVPMVGFTAQCEDSEGNRFNLLQHAPEAH